MLIALVLEMETFLCCFYSFAILRPRTPATCATTPPGPSSPVLHSGFTKSCQVPLVFKMLRTTVSFNRLRLTIRPSFVPARLSSPSPGPTHRCKSLKGKIYLIVSSLESQVEVQQQKHNILTTSGSLFQPSPCTPSTRYVPSRHGVHCNRVGRSIVPHAATAYILDTSNELELTPLSGSSQSVLDSFAFVISLSPVGSGGQGRWFMHGGGGYTGPLFLSAQKKAISSSSCRGQYGWYRTRGK